MANGRIQIKRIFLCILGVATIVLVSMNFDRRLSLGNSVIKISYAALKSRGTTLTPTSPPSPPPPPPSPSPPPSGKPQWEDPGPYHVAYPRNYKFIINNTPTCRTRSPFLVMMVPVAPSDVAARDAIRKTWGNERVVQGELVGTLFIVGLPGGADAGQQQEKLSQENHRHRDLIQSDFQDSYHNLTIKTMVMLEWLAAHCTNASYVMKIDSDMFVHVPNLVKLLLDPGTAKQNYMSGLVWWHNPVLRDPLNKFYLPRDVIAEPEFPPYPLGMAYVMSLDLPWKILQVSPRIKPLYIEDVYLGMCLKHLGISPTDPPENTMFIINPAHPLSNCSLSKVIAVTTTSIAQMKSYWKTSKGPDAKC